jgi:hypothetical protein
MKIKKPTSTAIEAASTTRTPKSPSTIRIAPTIALTPIQRVGAADENRRGEECEEDTQGEERSEEEVSFEFLHGRERRTIGLSLPEWRGIRVPHPNNAAATSGYRRIPGANQSRPSTVRSAASMCHC